MLAVVQSEVFVWLRGPAGVFTAVRVEVGVQAVTGVGVALRVDSSGAVIVARTVGEDVSQISLRMNSFGAVAVAIVVVVERVAAPMRFGFFGLVQHRARCPVWEQL